MILDPEKCPIGTLGYLLPGGIDDFEHADDFDWFKEPAVILNKDRKWVSLHPHPLDNTFETTPGASVETLVFADWKSAVMHMLDRERTEAKELIEHDEKEIIEARARIGQANDIERWLYRAR